MYEYGLTLNDIQHVLTGMIKAKLTAAGQFADLLFDRAPLPAELLLSPESLNIDWSEIERVAEQACNMFDCPDGLKPGQCLGDWVFQIHEHWQKSAHKRLIFYTSGSTGEPQPNVHEYGFLVQEIICQLEVLPQAERIVSFAFPQHIYGFLFTIMLPKALNCPVLACPPFVTYSVVHNLGSRDLVVGFPLLWSKLLEFKDNIPEGIFGVTSTSPCPGSTIKELLRCGFQTIIEVYGSSETGGIGTRSHPDKPYTLLSCWEKNQQVKGRELVRKHPDTGQKTAYSAPDELNWAGKDCFRPRGRKDNAVQIAGKNVYPERISKILLKHPQITNCAVRPMNREEGTRLKAFIVLTKEGLLSVTETEMRRQIYAWMKKHLSAAEMPGRIDFGPELPQNAIGKIRDWQMTDDR